MLIVLTFAVSVFIVNKTRESNIRYATKFEFKYESLNIKLGRQYILNKTEFNIEPQNCTENIILISSDDNIIEIDSENRIIAKSLGNCIITAYIKSGLQEFLTTNITVNVNTDNYDDKEEFEINKTYSLSQNLVMLEIDGNELILRNNIAISQGESIIEIVEYESNRLMLHLKSLGNAKIVASTETKNIVINITVI